MNQEIRDEWIGDLESGKYPQTVGSLKDDKGYCCLGVLCEIYIRHHLTLCINWEPGPHTGTLYLLGNGGYLPVEVIKWAGLNSHMGSYYDDHGNPQSLAQHNDSGVDFKTIADIIRRHF